MIISSDRYDSLIQFYAERHGVDWRLLKAQIHAESAFNPMAMSPVGAKGLAQFMDSTWHEYGEGSSFDPEQSIKAQARYMAWLIERCDGELRNALAAYNFGIGRVKAGKPWPPETQKYVDKIMYEYTHLKDTKEV